ncbi:ATP binding [Ascochyta rabiei]|uniref:ATP binding n=1 Tax=Didymella rabiei TaxID=5454 RepID=A0A163HDK4_DIDRA|nr:ATP binding [Ascochyta rabiei]
MASKVPSICCIGYIGKHNNPLHISLFPAEERAPLEFQFLLSSCLDIFEARLPYKTADQDFGLLQAVDERLAMYGWLTNTGVKIVIVVDMEGRPATALDSKAATAVGLRDADLKPVGSTRLSKRLSTDINEAFRALQTAYIKLLRNPFYNPDEHSPVTANAEQKIGSTQITSRSFIQEVKQESDSNPANSPRSGTASTSVYDVYHLTSAKPEYRLTYPPVHLQKLYDQLKDYEPSIEYSKRLNQLTRAVSAGQDVPPPPSTATAELGSFDRSWIWRTLVNQKEQRDSRALTRVLTDHDQAMKLESPRGLMLHGEVGTGKSMLIDLFQECLPNRKKKRWHFDTFMLHTISRLEQLRKSRALTRTADGQDEYSLLLVARDLIETSPILFLDEFQFPDRVASKILSNLMTSFFQLGGVLIATSNRMPDELAKAAGVEFARPAPGGAFSKLGWANRAAGFRAKNDGAGQKGEFFQFLEVLKARCEVWEMEGKKDYRKLEVEEGGGARTLPSASDTDDAVSIATAGLPTGRATETDSSEPASNSEATLPKNYLIQPTTVEEMTTFAETFNAIIERATSHAYPIPWEPATLTVYGRRVDIPAQHNGVAFFTFEELCGAVLGPADYVSLASTYHTFIVTDVPILTFVRKHEARRMITLLDALYEARCRLLITAAAGPDETFFPAPEGATNEAGEEMVDDAVYPETYSEIHQDLTSPFRPNISSYGTNTRAMPDDALEDDPPNRARRMAGLSESDYGDEEAKIREQAKKPDFANVRGLTGEDEVFAVKRAQSRIWEMCSGRWWGKSGWWRPLARESRHWEGSSETSTTSTSSASVRVPPNTAILPELATEIRVQDSPLRVEGEKAMRPRARPQWENRNASADVPRDSQVFSEAEMEKMFSEAHAWGVGAWGKKAGAWGKGVEGLGEQRRERGGGAGEERKPREGEGEGEGETETKTKLGTGTGQGGL